METNKEKKSVKQVATELYTKGKEKVANVIHDAKENPDKVASAALTAVEGVLLVTGIGLSIHRASEASRTVYSDDIGESVVLNKKLTNRDKVEIDHLMAHDGMTKIEACRHIGKIK